jgi:transposase
LLDNEHLTNGDYLFLDSARIHGADATWELIFGLLSSKGVKLIWLPKYSPEFNSVELFWRALKENLRHLPSMDHFSSIQEKIVDYTASLPIDYVLNWFLEAITKWQDFNKKRHL